MIRIKRLNIERLVTENDFERVWKPLGFEIVGETQGENVGEKQGEETQGKRGRPAKYTGDEA